MNNTESFGNLDRREFLVTATGAAVAFGCGGCFSLKHRNAPLEAAMRKYVDDKLFGGIVCASNRGDLACVGLRTLSPAGSLSASLALQQAPAKGTSALVRTEKPMRALEG